MHGAAAGAADRTRAPILEFGIYTIHVQLYNTNTNTVYRGLRALPIAAQIETSICFVFVFVYSCMRYQSRIARDGSDRMMGDILPGTSKCLVSVWVRAIGSASFSDHLHAGKLPCVQLSLQSGKSVGRSREFFKGDFAIAIRVRARPKLVDFTLVVEE